MYFFGFLKTVHFESLQFMNYMENKNHVIYLICSVRYHISRHNNMYCPEIYRQKSNDIVP